MIKKLLIINILFFVFWAEAKECPGPVSSVPEYNEHFTSYQRLVLNQQKISGSLCVEQDLILKGQVELKNNVDIIVYGDIIGSGIFNNKKVNFYHHKVVNIEQLFQNPGAVVFSLRQEGVTNKMLVFISILKKIFITFIYVLLMYFFFYHIVAKVREKKGLPFRPKPPMSQLKREWIVSLSASITLLTILYYFDNFMTLVPYSNIYTDWNQYPSWYIPVSFLFVIITYDAVFYLGHNFILHRYDGFYKYMHFVHHVSKHPNPFTSFCFNPIEIMFNYFLFLALVMAIPMHYEVFKAFFLFNTMFSVYHHCGYEILPRNLNLFLNKYFFLVTPTYHNIHHLKYKYHYSFSFTFWDKIFRTEYKDWEKEAIYLFEGLWDKPKRK